MKIILSAIICAVVLLATITTVAYGNHQGSTRGIITSFVKKLYGIPSPICFENIVTPQLHIRILCTNGLMKANQDMSITTANNSHAATDIILDINANWLEVYACCKFKLAGFEVNPCVNATVPYAMLAFTITLNPNTGLKLKNLGLRMGKVKLISAPSGLHVPIQIALHEMHDTIIKETKAFLWEKIDTELKQND